MNSFGIIQFNCGNANYRSARPLFDAASPTEYPLLAIQEPFFNERAGSTYCPRTYTLIHDGTLQAKVCFMLSKTVGLNTWQFKAYSHNVATLQLRFTAVTTTIINVYNPISTGQTITVWKEIQQALNDADGEVLLLGDFNAHHPAWGGTQAATEPKAEYLRRVVSQQDLHLLTPRGEATWKRGQQQSVIDLTFASTGLVEKIIQCGTRDSWTAAKDHIPIDIRLDLTLQPPPKSSRFAVREADWTAIKQCVQNSRWAQAPDPITALQTTLIAAMKVHCPIAKPSQAARSDWSPQAALLLAGARRARRRYNATGTEHDRIAHKELSKQLKKEIARTSQANWRRYVDSFTSAPVPLHNKNLWTLSRWSRQRAGKPQAPPHLPAMRRTVLNTATDRNEEKVQILIEKFFPAGQQADLTDLTDIDDGTPPEQILDIPPIITKEELDTIIRKLPNNKAPGPDGLPNEVLKNLREDIVDDLADAISRLLADGTLPQRMRESTTIALRKEGKKDYTIPSSYRPIALENSLAKLIEKVLAVVLTDTAEKFNLLPWNQMGARKKRSTLSALEVLTDSVQTAWRARSGCVVSMLSLDLSGAFDNVSQERLLWILKQKGYPEWIRTAINNFMTERRTKIVIPGYTSDWIQTQSGIPQGSPLSPILFLFFISELLELFQKPSGGTLAFGFVDDTNIIAWGNTARENCKRLEDVHKKCLTWARRHGATFAPDKYQLIHLTRRRKDPHRDLASIVQIGSHTVKPQQSLRVLGVWVDPKLNWKAHITEAARKGNAAFEAMSRLMTSTWGPSMRRSRLLYSAVVRPTLLYGAQVWGTGNGDAKPGKSLLKPLQNIQNKCLRRTLGAYKQTPIAALEREAAIPPLDIQVAELTLEHSTKTKGDPVQTATQLAMNGIWASLERRRPAGRQRGRRPRPQGPRPLTTGEQVYKTAVLLNKEVQARQAAHRAEEERTYTARIAAWKEREHMPVEWSPQGASLNPKPQKHTRIKLGGHRHSYKKATELAYWADSLWETRWRQKAGCQPATTWKGSWQLQIVPLYESLPKHLATAAFLLRVEVLGLRAWLHKVGVPNTSPECDCGWHSQTVNHVVIHCPLLIQQRTRLYAIAGTNNLHDILSRPEGVQAVGQWLLSCGLLPHLRLAGQIHGEDTGDYSPLPELSQHSFSSYQ
jgi:hypothetical protein